MKTAAILARAGRQLQDAGFTRWTTPVLLDYLNVGVRKIMALLPDRFAIDELTQLTPNTVRQDNPDNCLVLIGPVRNMGADGSRPGPVISRTDQSALDAYTPAWRHSNGRLIYEWCPADDASYLVHPAPSVGLYIDLRYTPAPAALTNANDEVIPLPDRYEFALLSWVLTKAYAEDQEAGSAQLAASHYQAFMADLGMEVSSGS